MVTALRSTSLFAAVLAAACLWGADCTWLPDGTGGWDSAGRWKDGRKPAAGDNAYIDGDAPVSDGDMALVKTLRAVILNDEKSSVTFNLGADETLPFRIIGNGTIVKNGSHALTLGEGFDNLYLTKGGIVVNGGALHLPKAASTSYAALHFGPITVNAPGVLFMAQGANASHACQTSVAGLSGNGVVSNDTAKVQQLAITGGTDAAPFEFSGRLGPNVDVTMDGGVQHILTADDALARDFRLGYGMLGALTFGAPGAASSVGTGATLWIRGGGPSGGIRYLGEGETMTKKIRLQPGAQEFVVDGGPHGNLTVAGEWQSSRNCAQMNVAALDGAAGTVNTLDCAFLEDAGGVYSTYVAKRGEGTWRLAGNASAQFRGVFAAEQGVLEFGTVAERGANCALGTATICHSKYAGAKDETKAVPYALSVGNGTVPPGIVDATVGTLSYTGASASCASRPIAVSGAGRLRNDGTGTLEWTGATTYEPGEHALALDAATSGNVIRDVTNGVGRLSVVKEGAGEWTLDGNVDVAALESRGGVLKVKMAQNYRYYRFNVRKVWGDTEVSFMISRLALFDANGACVNLNLAYNAAANGKVAALRPGEVAFGGTDYTMSRPIANVFKENTGNEDDDICMVISPGGVAYKADDDATWSRIVMRLADDAGAAVKYDICAAVNGSGGTPYGREIKSWSLEGSVDGVVWDLLDAVTDNPKPTLTKYTWYSDGTDAADPIGYAVKPEGARYVKPTAVDCVAASNGGRVVADRPIAAASVRASTTGAGGTIDGFVFGASGTFVVTGDVASGRKYPLAFANCSGVENLQNWTVVIDGRERAKKHVIVHDDGTFEVVNDGLILLIR